jgi:NAD(P)-dependent dehydrogenase (short-subunit alcohol dehydrogenase family)
MTLDSKIAAVTGSSKGIGKPIALAFAKSREYRGIVVNSRKLAEAQHVADEIKSSGCSSRDTVCREAHPASFAVTNGLSIIVLQMRLVETQFLLWILAEQEQPR